MIFNLYSIPRRLGNTSHILSFRTLAQFSGLIVRRRRKVFGSDGLQILEEEKSKSEDSSFFSKEDLENRKINSEETSNDLLLYNERIVEKALPKYSKINGWDKDNSKLKYLRNVFSPVGKSDRSRGDVIVLEGKRLLADAIFSGFTPKDFLFSRVNLLKDIPWKHCSKSEFTQIPYKYIEEWSDLSTPTGLMASFNRQEIIDEVKSKQVIDLNLTFILDNIRNPDNMGSILRLGASAGCSSIITTFECVDIWNSKVLRSAAGAHFHIPVIEKVTWDKMSHHLPQHSYVALADIAHSENENSKLLNELEVAKEVEKLKLDSSNLVYKDKNENSLLFRDESYFEEEILQRYEKLPLKSIEYWNFKVPHHFTNVVLVIGGETFGISKQSKKFVHDHGGYKYFIPLKNNMNSLNVSCATSIILFQIQQILLKAKYKNEK